MDFVLTVLSSLVSDLFCWIWGGQSTQTGNETSAVTASVLGSALDGDHYLVKIEIVNGHDIPICLNPIFTVVFRIGDCKKELVFQISDEILMINPNSARQFSAEPRNSEATIDRGWTLVSAHFNAEPVYR
jgi:hypothetical protein